MNNDHFWLLVERGSYVATLFLGLAYSLVSQRCVSWHLHFSSKPFSSGIAGNIVLSLAVPLLFYCHFI